jgi:murein DD-endopeptidase MepM/ murein hydrolase activator NlpD
MRNRWYEPRTGRFLSEDPIGLAGGINAYGFAGADPVNKSDPTGLFCVQESRDRMVCVGPITSGDWDAIGDFLAGTFEASWDAYEATGGGPQGGVCRSPMPIRPVPGGIREGTGHRDEHPIKRRPETHKGLDLSAGMNTPVRAPIPGTPLRSGYQEDGAGHFVVLSHPAGFETKYMHLNGPASSAARFDVGDVIGLSGRSGRTTGPHLHFELWYRGKWVDPTGCLP